MVQPQQSHRPPLRSVLEAYVNVAVATYTARAGDRVIGVNRAGAVTITLPTAEVRTGRTYTIKDESGSAATNNITVATEGAETIDGSTTDAVSENYGAKTYYSDGSNWFTVPLLSVGSHTLASHSAKAHSDLTGIGTGDHHAQSHTLDSHTGTLQHEKGGLEADISAGDGFVEVKGGFTTVIKSNTAATGAPGATDDSAAGYVVGSVWIDTTNDRAYVCLDATATAAVWTEMTQGGGVTQATQTALEGETDEDTYAPPDLIKHSPGVAKGWCHIAAAGTLNSPDYNVASVTDTGVGDRTVVWDTDFSTAVYAASGSQEGDDTHGLDFPSASYAVGSLRVVAYLSGAKNDDVMTVSAHGDQ